MKFNTELTPTRLVPTQHFSFAVDGTPAGEAVLDTHGFVWGVEIYTDFRGLGLGRLLMFAVENYARRFNFPKLRLYVRPENAVARNLYASLGFAEEGESHRGVLMVKVLGE